jgi:DNA-binding winged helix-turn-helix (wHTH) protein
MRFTFGNIVVDSEQIRLTKNGISLDCEPRVFELLVYFCNQPQEAISREVLVNDVWKGRTVSDAAVNRAVGELRKLIEDNPSSPQWIKTISKVGYRLAVIPTLMENQNVDKEQSHFESISTNSVNEVDNVVLEQEEKAKVPSKYKLSLGVAFILLIILIFYSIFKLTKPTDGLELVNRQPVTSTMGSAFNPFYSNETDTLYYLYRSEKTPLAQVYFQKGSTSPHALSTDDYYYTDVIADNDNNIYVTRLNNLEQRDCEIAIYDSVNKQFNKILNCGKRVVTQLVVDEKRRRLIYRFRASISEPYSVHSYQLDTGRKEQLTHPAQLGNTIGDYLFTLSKDNHTLAVVEYDGNGTDKIKFIDLNDNKILATVPFLNNVYGLIWREKNLLIASNNDGLFTFDTQNFKLETVENSDQFGRISYDKNSEKVFTERGQMTVNIFKYSMNSPQSKALTESSGVSQWPTFGHHSNLIAFISDRTGQLKIYIQEGDKAAIVAEFDEDIEYVSAMSWSPDDEQLVVSMNNGLYIYSLKKQNWQKLASEFTKVHHVTFAQEFIMFSTEIDGKWNVWQLSLANNDVKQITTKGGYSVQGNDEYLYYTKFSQEGLYQFDLKMQEETLLIPHYPIAGWRHWQLRDENIYYLLNKEYKALNLITGKEKILHKFESKMPFSCETAFNHDFFACDKIEVNTSNIWQFQLSQ